MNLVLMVIRRSIILRNYQQQNNLEHTMYLLLSTRRQELCANTLHCVLTKSSARMP